MSASSYKCVGISAKSSCLMIIVLELSPHTIVYDHQSDIAPYMSVPKRVEIVKSSEVTHNTKEKLVWSSQRCTDKR